MDCVHIKTKAGKRSVFVDDRIMLIGREEDMLILNGDMGEIRIDCASVEIATAGEQKLFEALVEFHIEAATEEEEYAD